MVHELCGLCGKNFQDKIQFVNHMKNVHLEEHSHCNECGQDFSSKRKLVNHMKAHKKIMFRCTYCDYESVVKGNLKRHEMKHYEQTNQNVDIQQVEFIEHEYKCNSCVYNK